MRISSLPRVRSSTEFQRRIHLLRAPTIKSSRRTLLTALSTLSLLYLHSHRLCISTATTPSSSSTAYSPKPTTANMPPKRIRCTAAQCREPAQRIVGDCSFCQGHFCGKHRLLEDHKCTGLEDVSLRLHCLEGQCPANKPSSARSSLTNATLRNSSRSEPRLSGAYKHDQRETPSAGPGDGRHSHGPPKGVILDGHDVMMGFGFR